MKESISKILLTSGYSIFLITLFIFIINFSMIIKSNSYDFYGYVISELDTLLLGFLIMLLFFAFSNLIKIKRYNRTVKVV
jgi:hypothetical protein